MLLGLQTINADSGSVALVYPLTDITNDGQFSDGPGKCDSLSFVTVQR